MTIGHLFVMICENCKTDYPLDYFLKWNRKCRSCRAAIHKEWRATDGGVKHYSKRRWLRHGLTREDYEGMLWVQDNKCAICEAPDPTHVDHDHSHCPGPYGCAKCVRGLLCRNCNTAIGLLQDSPKVASAAVGYLELSYV